MEPGLYAILADSSKWNQIYLEKSYRLISRAMGFGWSLRDAVRDLFQWDPVHPGLVLEDEF